ncbi:hypothetical protein B0H10DRAFT_2210475 [Mycena sp. CBHHK59/15]|nr:hypothetical protein B0H10DRAFT_2210475 [Mycena sp. CBHHK59/15]
MPPDDEPSGTAPQSTPDITSPTSPTEGEEQALEWHEVIELQTFSERKAWIEEKIKFLEQMPPIEVFVGMDAIRTSAEDVPGLPSRQELQQWLVEHDAIEKETEIFDSGELKTIKKFTKAATQRNLSPADTDLIELTLTTIYELDKLLHLLRDRSEHLELLGIRLTWEGHRVAAWVDRRSIIADLKTFLDTRARWTPVVYEEIQPPSNPKSNRRDSMTSLASMASDTLLLSAGFSRSARFKLAEVLSRDAAQFSARVTSLRHNKIALAGKMLDKLIDTSRKAVPEELLDEQDRLEEKGIADMEHIGKFVMNAVMQWRKADEIYVESMKDQVAAQNLLDEIEIAKFQHPTARQSTSFATKADALIKRLILRGDPASSTTTFPSPTHVLFPEHEAVNQSVVQTLSSEIATALELARKAETVAKEYRLNYEAVNRVETLVRTASDLSTSFTTIIERLEKGVSSTEGDGTPPNLMSETCLEPTRHAAFLALLPSILKELETFNESATQALRSSRGALLGLDRPDINSAFKTKAIAEFQRLSTLRGQAQWTRDDVTARNGRLREARKIWNVMDGNLHELEDIRREVGEAMEKHRWQQETNAGAPLTPESFSAPLPVDSPPLESVKRLDGLSAKLTQEVDVPLASLSRTLEAPLHDRLSWSSAALKSILEQVRQMVHLLQAIQSQATAMSRIRDEFNEFQLRIDDLRIRFDTGIEDILADKLLAAELSSVDTDLKTDIDILRKNVNAFTGGLSQRVPFVSRGPRPSSTANTFVKRRFSSVDLKLGTFDEHQSVELPFDLQSLDDAVRADSNSYVMRLGGELQSLEQRSAYFQLAQMAKEVDSSLSSVVSNINQVVHELSTFNGSLDTIQVQTNISQPLAELLKDIADLSQARRNPIARSFSPIRELLRRMEAAPGVNDAAVRESLYLARTRAVDDAELRFKVWIDDTESLTKQVAEAQRIEAQRLEAERIAEEQRLQIERECLAAEEAERARLERERLEEEQRLRLEEARLAEERRLQAEKERIAAEEAAQALLLKEQFEAAQRVKLEQARLEEERRLEVEKERAAAEEAERARLEREHLEMEAKLKLVEEQLAEERRLQAERARLAADQAEQERLERERVEAERRVQAEKDRIAAEEAEKARLAVEQAERERLERERLEKEERERAEEVRRLQAEKDRIAAGGAEMARLEAEKAEQERLKRERLAMETKLKLVEEQLAEERRLQAERARLAAEQAEQERLEREHVEAERLMQAEKDRIAAEEVEKACIENERLAEAQRIADEDAAKEVRPKGKAKVASPVLPDHDVFGLRLAPSESAGFQTAEMRELQAHILALRKRLRAMSIEGLAGSSSLPAAYLPTQDEIGQVIRDFFLLCEEVAALPQSAEHPSVDLELNSLRTEVTRSTQSVGHLENLAKFSEGLQLCDAALSDLLEHIDTYPGVPLTLTSSFKVPTDLSAEEQLASRLSFTSSAIERMLALFASVAHDQRTITERDRIQQTWSELEEMAAKRVASIHLRHGAQSTCQSTVECLIVHPFDSTALPVALLEYLRIPSNHFSQRVRGFFIFPSYHESLSVVLWIYINLVSCTEVLTRIFTIPQKRYPPKEGSPPRKKYVANPKNKLDVAVGDVINQLPVGINIEGVSESWRDQSGKYWIGDQDPKLCFCRILRSQTVMVRVGGGWTELSKFIKDHFADSFRLVPESPPRQPGGGETKWISSTTLLEAQEPETPPQSPRTPEPHGFSMPSFSIMTPSGHSPQSLKSSPSNKGSPSALTPLQFIRRRTQMLYIYSLSPLQTSISPSHTDYTIYTCSQFCMATMTALKPVIISNLFCITCTR